MSGHAGMPVLPLSELEWIGLVNEKEDVLSDPRKNGRRGVFFLDFYLSWMSRVHVLDVLVGHGHQIAAVAQQRPHGAHIPCRPEGPLQQPIECRC